jgi:hypothetical protein
MKGNSVELFFRYKDFTIDVLHNEIVKLNLDLGVYFVELYTGDRKIGNLKPFYIDYACTESFKDIISSLYRNIILVLAYLNVVGGLEDNMFKLVISKDMFVYVN